MTSLFPALSAPESVSAASGRLPLYRDVSWDFAADRPIYANGEPVIVTGAEAVGVWAYNALKTARYRYEIWSRRYGSDLERLIGQPFGVDTKRAEAVRYIREALLCFPYVKDVLVGNLALEASTFSAAVDIITVYGGTKVYV